MNMLYSQFYKDSWWQPEASLATGVIFFKHDNKKEYSHG